MSRPISGQVSEAMSCRELPCCSSQLCVKRLPQLHESDPVSDHAMGTYLCFTHHVSSSHRRRRSAGKDDCSGIAEVIEHALAQIFAEQICSAWHMLGLRIDAVRGIAILLSARVLFRRRYSGPKHSNAGKLPNAPACLSRSHHRRSGRIEYCSGDRHLCGGKDAPHSGASLPWSH